MQYHLNSLVFFSLGEGGGVSTTLLCLQRKLQNEQQIKNDFA